MSHETSQGTEVKVTRVVMRLVPCERHAFAANGQQTAMQNPNGYRHDCQACAEMPRKYEELED